MLGMLRSLWLYRYFVASSVRNELVNRFVSSKLGGLWTLIHPLAQVAIYALIFSNVVSAKLPDIDNKYAYAIYLMAGLLAWTLFSETISRCLNLFIEHANLMKKINFPRITLPAIVSISALLNNLLLFVAMIGIFAILGHQFSAVMLWLVLLTAIVVIFGMAIGLILGVINVFVRDTGQVVPIVLQMLFWFTPIVYPISIIPESYRHWLNLNPLYPITEAYHQVLVYGGVPHWESLLPVTIISILLGGMSLFMFRRANAEIVDNV